MLKYLLLFLILLGSCSSPKYEVQTDTSLTIEEFIQNPFPQKVDIDKFRKNHRNLKYRKYIRTPQFNASLKDTVYRFFSGKTNVLFYKPQQKNKIYLLSTTIGDKKVQLKNGIRTGLSISQVRKKFVDFPELMNDTIRFSHSNKMAAFIFEDNKVAKIMIYQSKSKKP